MKPKIENKPEPTAVDKTAELEAKANEYLADLQRTRADFENFRKQTDLQREQAKAISEQSTVLKFLPLIDDMARAIEANKEALGPLEKSFEKTLKSLDLEKITTKPGTAFDPSLHEAVMVEEGEGDKELIAETLQTGYYYQGNVLRPALVKVKKS